MQVIVIIAASAQRGLGGKAWETRVGDKFVEGISNAPLEGRRAARSREPVGRGRSRAVGRHTNMFRTQFGLKCTSSQPGLKRTSSRAVSGCTPRSINCSAGVR